VVGMQGLLNRVFVQLVFGEATMSDPSNHDHTDENRDDADAHTKQCKLGWSVAVVRAAVLVLEVGRMPVLRGRGIVHAVAEAGIESDVGLHQVLDGPDLVLLFRKRVYWLKSVPRHDE